MRRSLKQGRSVGLHVDVRVDGGETFPLLGAPATTTTAPAWLWMCTKRRWPKPLMRARGAYRRT